MFGKLFVWCLLTLMNFFEKWKLLAKKENLSAELRANDIDIYHVTGSMIKAFYIPLPLILPEDPMSDLHHHPTLQWEPGVRDILWLFQGNAVNRSDRNKRWLWPSKEVKRRREVWDQGLGVLEWERLGWREVLDLPATSQHKLDRIRPRTHVFLWL